MRPADLRGHLGHLEQGFGPLISAENRLEVTGVGDGPGLGLGQGQVLAVRPVPTSVAPGAGGGIQPVPTLDLVEMPRGPPP